MKGSSTAYSRSVSRCIVRVAAISALLLSWLTLPLLRTWHFAGTGLNKLALFRIRNVQGIQQLTNAFSLKTWRMES